MSERERYSRLEPLTVEEKLHLAQEACNFFFPLNYHKMCKDIGIEANKTIRPLSVLDFLQYLTNNKKIGDAHKQQYQIKILLDSLEHAGILTAMGQSNFVMAPETYYFIKEYTELEKTFHFWLAPALGASFLKFIYERVTIHITGKTDIGDIHAGTGVLIDNNHILTCAHVIDDMTLDTVQIINGLQRTVSNTTTHKNIDVGLITLDNVNLYPASPVAFRDPEIAERVHTLGFPRIPLSREPALIMQSGEVVSAKITTIHNDEVFLYSAIARPGNSGGPIISESGYIVGIVSQDLSNKDSLDAPFYAGVPTTLIQKALSELGSDIQIPIENYK